MAGVFETIYDAIAGAAALFMKRPGEMAAEFAKVAAMGLGLQLAFLFIIMAIASGILSGASGAIDALMIVFIVLAVILAIAFFILSTALSAAPYSIVDGIREGRRTGIIAKTRELIPRVSGYCAVIAGIFAIVFGLAIGGGVLLGGDPIASGFLMLGALSAIVIAVFLFQFALPEMAVGGMDAVGALKSSFTAVMKSVWIVLVFDIVLLILLFGTVMAFAVPQGLVEAQMKGAGDNVAASLLLFMVSLAFSLLETIIVSLVSVNMTYSLWRTLASPAGGAPAEPQPSEGKAPHRPRRHSKQ